LLEHAKWGWYVAVVMWTVEGAVVLYLAIYYVVYYTRETIFVYPSGCDNIGSHFFLQFASTAYVVKKRIREGFHLTYEPSGVS